MSRTARFMGGLRMTYIHQAVVTVVGLWLTPFLLRHIGQHDYGLWLLATQITGYLLLLDLGALAFLPREIAYVTGSAAADDAARQAQLERVVARTWRMVLRQWPLVFVAAIGAWFWVARTWPELSVPFAWLVAVFVALFPARIYQTALVGLQDLHFVGRVILATWVLQTAVTIVTILMGGGLWSLVTAWITSNVIPAVVAYWRLRHHFGLHVRRANAAGELLAGLYRRGLWSSASSVASVLVAGTDLFVIGKLLGPAAAVPYALTGKLVGVFGNQPHAVVHAALPALAELRAQRDSQRLANVMAALCLSMLLVSGGIASVILAANEGFVRWWVGNARFGGLALSTLLVVLMIGRHWLATYTYSLFAFGYERLLALLALGDGVVTVTLMYFLVRWLGPIGAPIGSVASAMLVGMPIVLWALSREMELSIAGVIAPLVPWLLRFVPYAALCWAYSHFFMPHGFVGIAAVSAVAALGYTVLMIPFVLRSPLEPYLRDRIPRRAWRAIGVIYRLEPA